MGELKIRVLRQRAKGQLDDQFDLREFHDVILENGSVPLRVLGRRVEGYVEGER